MRCQIVFILLIVTVRGAFAADGILSTEKLPRSVEGDFKTGRRFTIQEQADAFPVEDRRDNREIAEDYHRLPKMTIREAARIFSNQNRPDNQELIRQQIRQRAADPIVFLDGSVILSVAGLNDGEMDPFQEVLKQEIGAIRSIERWETFDGVAEYKVQISGGALEFAEQLDGYVIGALHLEKTSFHPHRMEFLLKQ
ncbi:MAG: hypothetical protein KC713_01200 [Candidatus Omnitrophica bacterium]|nr:hypothetical protein [Candidatus Omnitrophota bacterium]